MTTGAMEGLLYCGNILIPSLFPFAVFSALAVKSGFAESFGRWLSPISKRLFHTDGTVATVILLGFAGGFPIGAKGVATLYEERKISKVTAQALTMFLVGGGVGFTVTVIGVSFYRNVVVGLILWGCQIFSQILLGVIACRKIKYQPIDNRKIQRKGLSECIVKSTKSGVESMLLLCGMVVLFSCIFGIVEDVGIIEYIEFLLEKLSLPVGMSKSLPCILWEVTKGCQSCFNEGCPLWLISFALGWGGICVHFQIYALVSELEISKGKFMLYRLCQGGISAVLSLIVMKFYQPTVNVYGTVSKYTANLSTANYTGSVALIGMSLIFIGMCNSNVAKK